MGIFAAILFVLGTVAAVFGWWGQHTRAGQLKYDEMAGMIPFFCLVDGTRPDRHRDHCHDRDGSEATRRAYSLRTFKFRYHTGSL